VSGPRFEVRAVPDGFGIHDLQEDRLLEQPGLPAVYWWPPTARPRAQAWVDRQIAATTSGYP
jgi:hypothetical protein